MAENARAKASSPPATKTSAAVTMPISWADAAEGILRCLWPVIISHAFVLLALLYPDQGKEILGAATSDALSEGVFLLSASVFALSTWLLARTANAYVRPDFAEAARDGTRQSQERSILSFALYKFPCLLSVTFLFILAIWLALSVGAWWSSLCFLLTGLALIVFTWELRLKGTRFLLGASCFLAVLLIFMGAFAPVTLGLLIGSITGAYAILFLGALLLIIVLEILVWLYSSLSHRIKFRPLLLATLVVVVALAAAFGIPVFRSPDRHQIRCDGACDSANTANPAPFPATFDDAVARWEKENPNDGTMIVVAAAGGGARAGYWTATILGAIEDAQPSFGRRVFAISAVSGGAVGAAAFTAALGPNPPACGAKATEPPYRSCLQEFLSYDFLSPILTAVFTGEWLRKIISHNWFIDRAAALELAWENAWGRTFAQSDAFSQPFRSLWSAPSYRPNLLLNGTSALSGRRLLTSSVELSDDLSVPIVNLGTLPIKLSTAVDNSTRFPVVEPPGGVPIRQSDGSSVQDYVVDGGFYDNYGAATMLDLLRKMDEHWKTAAPPRRLIIVAITSDPDIADQLHDDLPDTAAPPPAQKPAERSSDQDPTIFGAAMAARQWSGLIYAKDLLAWRPSNPNIDVHRFHFALQRTDPPLPLGWSLAKSSRESVNVLLNSDRIQTRIKNLSDLLSAKN
jgi:hypothetical protein